MSFHPLDPLSVKELQQAVAILKKAHPSVRFVYVGLQEPAKHLVLSYKPGDTIPRESYIVGLEGNKSFEYVVSITNNHVVSRTHVNGQAGITSDEYAGTEKIVKEHPDFLAALKKRGISNIDQVMVDLWTVGHLDDDDAPTRRLARPFAFYKPFPGANGYGCPIEGVSPLVDLETMTVVRIDDYGVVPLPPYEGGISDAYLTDPPKETLKKLQVIQPDGVGFKLDGHQVSWMNWKFRIGFNPREGLVIYQVTFDDHGRERPILYRASMAEMIVPYGIPKLPHARKNAFDVGEEGVGYNAKTLKAGCDCIGEPSFYDVHMTSTDGTPVTIEDAICVHEEDAGLAWRHCDWRNDATDVRRGRRLVVSFFTTVANYDYGFRWQFYLDGTIKVDAELTGILSTVVTPPGEKSRYGTQVATNISGTFHQHFFCMRIDSQVDGLNNTVYEVHSEREPRGVGNPFLNAFTAKHKALKTEKEAQRENHPQSNRFWLIANDNKKNAYGDSPAYALVPFSEGVLPFAYDDSHLLQRAPFLRKHLWVTPFNQKEKYPAGDFPNQNKKENAGLVSWTAQNRSIENKDIVLWYTVGVNHIPRPEDYPIMPVVTAGFALRAHGFFDRNPETNMPPEPCQTKRAKL